METEEGAKNSFALQSHVPFLTEALKHPNDPIFLHQDSKVQTLEL